MQRAKWASVVAACALVAACGGGGGNADAGGGGGDGGGGDAGGSSSAYSCNLGSPALENTTACLEYAGGWSESQAQMLCGNVMASAAPSACSRDGVIGGCRTTETLGLAPEGATTTMWFKPTMGSMVTAAQVMAHCGTMSGYTYVAP